MGSFLEELASDAPTPGGGAAAGVVAAVGAALISMVANLTKDDSGAVASMGARAERLRADALAAADDDAVAFGAVGAAYRLPKDDPDRAATIQRALARAAEPPLAVLDIAVTAVGVAEELLPVANRNVVSDIAVAARCLGAAVDGAAANVLVNLSLLKDAVLVSAIFGRLEPARRDAVARAGALADRVEERWRA